MYKGQFGLFVHIVHDNFYKKGQSWMWLDTQPPKTYSIISCIPHKAVLQILLKKSSSDAGVWYLLFFLSCHFPVHRSAASIIQATLSSFFFSQIIPAYCHTPAESVILGDRRKIHRFRYWSVPRPG